MIELDDTYYNSAKAVGKVAAKFDITQVLNPLAIAVFVYENSGGDDEKQ